MHQEEGYHSQYPVRKLRVWTPDKEIPKREIRKHGVSCREPLHSLKASSARAEKAAEIRLHAVLGKHLVDLLRLLLLLGLARTSMEESEAARSLLLLRRLLLLLTLLLLTLLLLLLSALCCLLLSSLRLRLRLCLRPGLSLSSLRLC